MVEPKITAMCSQTIMFAKQAKTPKETMAGHYQDERRMRPSWNLPPALSPSKLEV